MLAEGPTAGCLMGDFPVMYCPYLRVLLTVDIKQFEGMDEHLQHMASSHQGNPSLLASARIEADGKHCVHAAARCGVAAESRSLSARSDTRPYLVSLAGRGMALVSDGL